MGFITDGAVAAIIVSHREAIFVGVAVVFVVSSVVVVGVIIRQIKLSIGCKK